jgi:N6-L-threonylcarbamoyladenine synthase/protein kinase Bud32
MTNGLIVEVSQSKLHGLQLMAEGAEAKIYSTDVKGLACVLKDRIKKGYRLPVIDERLRRLRTRHERSLLARAARAGVNVPKVLDVESSETRFCMEEISGPKVRDYLLEYSGDEKKVIVMCKLVGKQVAKMHQIDITHGDLTTSNMVYDGSKVFLIDFGLGQVSKRLEDKAVDLHLLKECLRSKHFDVWMGAWKVFRKEYEKLAGASAFEQLKLVEARGRYRKLSSRT